MTVDRRPYPRSPYYRTVRKIRITFAGSERAYLIASGNPGAIIAALHTIDRPVRMASVRLTKGAEFFVTNTSGRDVAEAIRILTAPRVPVMNGDLR